MKLKSILVGLIVFGCSFSFLTHSAYSAWYPSGIEYQQAITENDRYYFYSLDDHNLSEAHAGVYRIDMKSTGDAKAPYVQGIEFSAPALLDQDGVTIAVQVKINDSQGIGNIDWVILRPLVEGQEAPAWPMARGPLAFPTGDPGSTYLYDDGTHGDVTAGDGIFSFDSIATRKGDRDGEDAFNTWYQHYPLPAEVGIRIIVKDEDNNYALADAVLTICDDDCGLQAILNESTGSYFNTIQEAYNNALDQATLLCQGAVFSENLLFNDAADKTIVLKGGYDQAFSENLSGVTQVDGSITISRGSIVFSEGSFLVSATDEQLAKEKVAEGILLLDSGDFSGAKDKFSEALDANPNDPEANAGLSFSVLGEKASDFKSLISDITSAFVGTDLSSGSSILLQIFDLLESFPFYSLSTKASSQSYQSWEASSETYEIGIDFEVPDSLKECVLRITKGVPVFDSSYFSSMATLKAILSTYKSPIAMILPFIRKAETYADLSLEISADTYQQMFDHDLDGDGIGDFLPPGDRICIDQGDLYVLDAMICMIIGIGDVLEAYNFTGSSFDIIGDTNQDGYISPDEYLPARPYYTLVDGGAEMIRGAKTYLNTALEKLETAINLTLAETEDYYEIFPVNTDSGLRAFLQSLKNSNTRLDLQDLKGMMAGTYNFDLSKGAFYLPGQSIRVNLGQFFDNPQDFRSYLPDIRIANESMEYRSDHTLGGVVPDGDLDDIFNYALGISTLTGIPVIYSLSSYSVDYGDTVTITGEGLGASQGESTLSIGNRTVPASDILSWSDTEIQFRMPSNILPGRLRVTVSGMLSNSKRIEIGGMTVDNFDEVSSAEMAGDPPTTINSGVFVYDIFDTPNPYWLGHSKSIWTISAAYPGYMLQTNNIWETGPGYTDPNTGYFKGSNLVLKDKSLSNFSFTACFGSQSENYIFQGSDDDGIGIVFRYQDEDNYYRLISVRDPDENGPFTRLEKWTNGNLTVLGLSQDPDDAYKDVLNDGLVTGDSNEFKVEANGTNIKAYLRVYVNNELIIDRLIFDVSDSTFASGRVGISTYAMCWTWLDYIAIQEK